MRLKREQQEAHARNHKNFAASAKQHAKHKMSPSDVFDEI